MVTNAAAGNFEGPVVQAGTVHGDVNINSGERAQTAARCRPGEPGSEAAFQEAYEAAGGVARLGNAQGLARQERPGWAQDFEGGPDGEPAVLCGLFNKSVVAVARTIWNEITAIGDGPVGGTVGVGFPVPARQASTAFIGSDTEIVQLAGGAWGRHGRGKLIRRPLRPPVWQPEITFDSNVSYARDIWTSVTDTMDLRVRSAARIPLHADEWRITGATRRRMVAALTDSDLADVVRRLALRLGLDGTPTPWQEINVPEGRNNSRFATHEITVTAADGRPAVKIAARLNLPDGRRTELLALVDLRVDFDAIRPADPTPLPADIPAELRVTLAELTDFYARAWDVATVVLPLAATDDPLAVPPAGAPTVEFYIQSERPTNLSGERTVKTLDMIDLSPLGAPRDPHVGDLGAAVTTPLGLPKHEIETHVHTAMVRIADDFGFA